MTNLVTRLLACKHFRAISGMRANDLGMRRPRRPSFTGGGTDNCAYGWFIWHKQAKGPTTLGFMMGGHG